MFNDVMSRTTDKIKSVVRVVTRESFAKSAKISLFSTGGTLGEGAG
jgi:hypothetical protein